VSGGQRLEWHLARAPSSAARDATRNGIVIAHGFPEGPGAAAVAAQTFPELADRVAQDTGWAALSFSFRGVGRSPGAFSPAGWLEDLRAAVALLRAEVASVWLLGFGIGGALAVRVAADDPIIGGLVLVAAPSDLSGPIADPASMVRAVRETGMVPARGATLRRPSGGAAGRDADGGPPVPVGGVDDADLDGPDLEIWGSQLAAIDPLDAVRAVPPRPLLIVHGSADAAVPVVDARAFADAAEHHGALRVIPMAGHRLRHDPRAIAIVLGWLERQEA